MTNIPELTDAEANCLRNWATEECNTQGDLFEKRLLRHGSVETPSDRITDLGRAALAAYDAKERAAIRVEAMRECEEIALANLAVDPPYDHELEVQENIAEAIREKIAKEPTQ